MRKQLCCVLPVGLQIRTACRNSVAGRLKETEKQREDKLSQHEEEDVTADAEGPNNRQVPDFNESVNSLEEIYEAVSVFGVTISPMKYHLSDRT